MRFPISREDLQAFDPVKEKEIRDELAIKNHIESLALTICTEVERALTWRRPTISGIARFGIKSSVELQRIEQEELEHYKTIDNKRFIWCYQGRICQNLHSVEHLDTNCSKLIPLLVEKLKGLFIDCNITIDHLNANLIIDWS